MAPADLPSSDTEEKLTILSRIRFRPTRRQWRILAVIALIASVFGTGVAWAVSSPIGASPDDDYHLGSIWCTPPL